MKKLLMLTLASSILLLPAACKRTPSGEALVGRISFIVGDVSLNGHPAAKDESVKPGDMIETKNNSSCEVIVADKNILMVAPDSRMVYNLKSGDGRLELLKGGFGALLRNKLPFGDFTITTRTVTASIRGTAFYIAAESEDKTYACVCNGMIRFKPGESGTEKTVAASHHKAFYYTRKNGAVVIEEGGLKYHTDASMEKEAAAIGETIDWNRLE
ncbi:MAG TPA: FecR family protein [Spirochaetota bacterium]|nr:FecR domain-containing protein [Spirochaetota bacterium]HOD15390.1 FecR family protein [Spirochaetota bacterium]HPG51568.1 FecR family protein [Spirochaetota bacterium]HPN11252.1 FecR family protein [Spirochaetota bacterium]HQL81434.1 FecR family protein [Spirochaetota bacterium]